MAQHRLLIHGARQVVQVASGGEKVLSGDLQGKLALLQQEEGQQGFSVVVDGQGVIAAVGRDDEIAHQYSQHTFERRLDATGKCVIPGLVDGHTHPVWAGDRVHEFAMKLAGATYLQVHQAGGGIHFTVDHVTRATEDELYSNYKGVLERMSRAGTTLAEVKSGYGLTTDVELKMLRVIQRARSDRDVNVDTSATYCGAHAVPKGQTAEQATHNILQEQLPALQALMQAGQLQVDNIDVFCERNCFDVQQTQLILQAGQRAGLQINFHGEELSCLHSAEMGAALGARAISHLEEVSEGGVKAMAEAGTIAVLLPTTAYILRLQSPPARSLVSAGVPVALGSDFNPNAHCLAMPVVMHLACVLLGLSMEEALVASTINAAASVGRSASHGSIEVGKRGDCLVLDAHRWEHLIYQFGDYHHVIAHVIKDGKIVHSK